MVLRGFILFLCFIYQEKRDSILSFHLQKPTYILERERIFSGKDEEMLIQEMKGKGEVLKGLFTDKNQVKEGEVGISEKKIELGEAGNRNIHTRIQSLTGANHKLKEEDKRLNEFKEKARSLFEQMGKNRENLSAELLKRVQEEGFPAEDADADLVGKSIETILETREIKRERFEKQVEKLEETRENIKRMAISESFDKGVIRKLENSGLPVTEENVKKITNALEVADEAVKKLTEPAMKHLIENKLPETVENLYKAGHIVEMVVPPKASKEVLWEDIKESAKELLRGQGVEVNTESEEAAKWLFENDLEIHSDNIAEYLSLKELKEGAGEFETKENHGLKIVKKMAEGESPIKTVLGNADVFRARYSIHYFRAVVENKEVFREALARREIEEIRLKLTEESAMRMLAKGFKINVDDLKGLVERLREEEESYFRNLETITEEVSGKREEGKTGSERRSQVELFRTTLSIRAYTMGQKSESTYSYGSIFEVYRTKERLSIAHFYKAGLAYEKGGTEIRTDLGDSLKKAFSNIDEILKMHGESLTEENRRAVKLLAYNHAEVSEESIFRMKKSILLSEEVFREMKPATVVSLIKRGENPLDLPMEELLAKLKEINRELKPEEERFSSYLYKIEKAGEVSGEERKAYIGIFRLLSQIEKGDYAAVGSVSLAEKNMNLKNLLSAIRTGKQEGFDKKIEEGFGELSRSLSENRIDRQIEEAYQRILAGRLKEEISEEDEAYFKERERELRTGKIEVSDVEKLLEEGGKISLSNTLAQMEIRNGRKALKTFLSALPQEEKEEIDEGAREILEGFDGIEETLEKGRTLSEKIMDKLVKTKEEIQEYSAYRNLITVQAVMNLSINRMERESFDLPIFYDEDKVADLQITIRSGKVEEERGKIEMKLSFEEAEVKAEFRLSHGRVSGILLAERREEYERLKSAEEALREGIQKLGLKEGEISYHLGKTSSQIISFDDIYSSEPKKKEMYELAKQIASHVLRVMGMQAR